MIYLPTEIIDTINDFRVGDKQYHKQQFNNVVNQLHNVSFYCKTCWTNKDCNLCYNNHTEFTVELNYDDALKTYLNDFIGRRIQSCGCVIASRKLSFVNQRNYYDELIANNYYSETNSDYSNSDY